MIVVDTNVVAWLFLSAEKADVARAVLGADPEWCAPLLWRSELRNVLAGAMRRRACDLSTAARIARDAEGLLTGGEYAVEAERVLRLVAASRCSAYDCEFVALADELGLPLVTGDAAIREAFPDIARSPEAFARGR